jgi:hypothetical protein
MGGFVVSQWILVDTISPNQSQAEKSSRLWLIGLLVF